MYGMFANLGFIGIHFFRSSVVSFIVFVISCVLMIIVPLISVNPTAPWSMNCIGLLFKFAFSMTQLMKSTPPTGTWDFL